MKAKKAKKVTQGNKSDVRSSNSNRTEGRTRTQGCDRTEGHTRTENRDKTEGRTRIGRQTKHRKVPFDKPGNFLYPIPAVMVSCGSMEKPNIITVAWTGTICSDPAMVSISVRPERYSHDIISESGEFVINLTTRKLVRACDYCGIVSGRDVDKFEETHLTAAESEMVSCPSIAESPVSIECKVRQMIPLGSHDMFLAEVVSVSVDSSYIDSKGRFQMNKTDLAAYSHGEYLSLGKRLGTFGFSVRKKRPAKRR